MTGRNIMEVKHIDIESVHMFSDRDRDYYLHPEKTAAFLKYNFEHSEIKSAIEERRKFDTDRDRLYSVVKNQYAGISSSETTLHNIEKLLEAYQVFRRHHQDRLIFRQLP